MLHKHLQQHSPLKWLPDLVWREIEPIVGGIGTDNIWIVRVVLQSR
jgi:hypothetical protein